MRFRSLLPLLLLSAAVSAMLSPAVAEPIDDMPALMLPDFSILQDPFSPAPTTPAEIMEAPKCPTLYILPLGPNIPPGDVEFVRRSLLAFYKVDVRVLPAAPLPPGSYYAPRRRYRAERILDDLARKRPPDGYRIIGITAKDISTTNRDQYDWGMLGLADFDRPVCVVSSYRCHSRGVSATRARVRLGKIAVREVGHTLGLPHCPSEGCIMRDAVGSVATCDSEIRLCENCRALLLKGGKPLTSDPDFAWDRAALDVR